MLMHFHAYVLYILYIFIYLNCFGTFLSVSFFPPHSLVYVSGLWHQNVSLFRPRTLFILGYPLRMILLLLLFGSMMRIPERTSQRSSLDKAFIRNAKSFFRTSPTLTYPLSFTVGVGCHCVMSLSPVHPC